MACVKRFSSRTAALAVTAGFFLNIPAKASAASEAELETTAPTIVVTATRIATPAGSLGSSVTVITADQIARQGYRTVSEALASVPGLTVRRAGGIGRQTSVFIRGANSNHTLFLLNGLDINDPSSSNGVYDPSQMPLDNVERIEVIRGPQSVLYGSDAIGGVINIITKTGGGEPNASIVVEGGTHGSYKVTAGAAGSLGPLDLRVDVSRHDTAGQNIAPGGVEKDGFESSAVSTALGADLTDNLRVDFFGQYIDSTAEVDGFFLDLPGAVNDREQFFLSGKAVAKFFDGDWIATLNAGISDQELTDTSFGVSTFNGTIYSAGLQNDVRIGDTGTATVGVEGEIQDGRSSAASFDAQFAIVSAFLQYQFEYWSRLTGTVGVRVDHHDSFGTEATWRAALAYEHPGTGTILRGTAATGFNAPSLTDIFGFFPGLPGSFDDFVGNPNLQPEHSLGFDFGIEQPLFGGDATVGVSFFYNAFDDLIGLDPNTDFNDGMADMLINIAEARAYGLEASVTVFPWDFMDLNANYTFLETEDLSNGGPLLRRPRHEFSATATLRPAEGATISTEIVYTGAQADFGGTIGDYVVVNVNGEYSVSDRLSFIVRAANLTDGRSQDPVGFLRPGLEVFGGMRLTLP